jgi:dihydroxy-acid dehydratase
VALRREWVADQVEIFYSAVGPDALLVGPCEPADLTGFLLAALRLNLPVVFARDGNTPFDVVPCALGLAPLAGDPVEAAVGLAGSDEARLRRLVDNFSLANALRAGLSAGAGPELLVHLAAVAREAGVSGFPRMIRVLAPESPTVADPAWLQEHGPAGLLAGLGDALHDTPTVTGRMKEMLPPAPPLPGAFDRRLFFPRGRASGTEVVCQADSATEEVAGECRVFASEGEAVEAVAGGSVGEGDLLVVAGCGARGGPGLLALDDLGAALLEAGLDVPVLTDGLPPSKVDAASPWISLFSPEAVSEGVIGLLRDGDTLRFDLVEGRIRTGVSADELAGRTPFATSGRSTFGYAARYARSALPALEGAGFG